MAEIRKDLVKDKWVAVGTAEIKPNDFPINQRNCTTPAKPGFCPFCEGNEAFTPPEIVAYRSESSPANSPGWQVRVVANKFTVFKSEGSLEEKHSDIYSSFNSLGRHEVIIEGPEHEIAFHQYSEGHIEIIFNILKQRYQALANDERIKYIQIYKNRGLFAGASLEHSHSQVVALPYNPEENKGINQYYQQTGHCLLCDILAVEQQSRERLVLETDHFLIFCPYAARFPYEAWVVPRRHCEHFGDISDSEIKELAFISKQHIRAVIDYLHNPAYNFMFNTAPVNTKTEVPFHWFMEITPRLLVSAGVEIATGLHINPIAPEVSAAVLRKKLQGLS